MDLALGSFLFDAELAALQPDTFTLATLSFDAGGLGTSPLSFGLDPKFGSNVVGRLGDSLSLTVGTAQVDVAAAAVPEPASLLLFGTGVLGLMGYAWRRRKMLNIVRNSPPESS